MTKCVCLYRAHLSVGADSSTHETSWGQIVVTWPQTLHMRTFIGGFETHARSVKNASESG
jgi:hypothetical protein